jgi:hypothetical protein
MRRACEKQIPFFGNDKTEKQGHSGYSNLDLALKDISMIDA